MPGSRASSLTRRAMGSATPTVIAYPPMPGTLTPPVAFSRWASAAARALSTAALTAAVTRSSSIARSPPSSALGSIASFVTSHLPLMVTLTRPPPLSASTEIPPSCSLASVMAFSSLRAWRIRYWMSIPSPVCFDQSSSVLPTSPPRMRAASRMFAWVAAASRTFAERDGEPGRPSEVAREHPLDLRAPPLRARRPQPPGELEPDLALPDPKEDRLAQRLDGGWAHLLHLLG